MNTKESCQDLQICRNLRSKEMYHSAPGEEEEDDCASGIYWCIKSQEVLGPDGEPVGKAECCASRKCYVG